MILMIDNYDSFTYNLVQYLGEMGHELVVYRNDAVTIPQIKALNPDHIVISPGPCTPTQAGISLELIRELGGAIPLLGVCLGHQAIAQAFGGRVVRAQVPMHGKTSLVHHDGRGIYEGIPTPFRATRYHSLVVDPEHLPDELEVTGWSEDGVIMSIRHRFLPVEGVQYHPEAILTEHGKDILARFVSRSPSVEREARSR